jgi:hypothetical protein
MAAEHYVFLYYPGLKSGASEHELDINLHHHTSREMIEEIEIK